MTATWFVVLSQSSMKLFKRAKTTHPLKHFKTVSNELVNFRSRDLARHKPGNPGVRPHDIMVQDFARRVAGYLDGQRKREQFVDLRIAAEPKFLGLFRKSLSEETKRFVSAWVKKDLDKADTEKLELAFAKI